MYKTVNRQYKRNILHFYTTVKQIAVSCLQSKEKLANTSTGTTHTLQKKYNFCPLKGTRGTFYVFTQRLTNCCFLFTKQGKTCKHFNRNYAYFAKNTTFDLLRAQNRNCNMTKQKKSHFKRSEIFCFCFNYLMILETTPDPTVWPPSRIAKRRPSSIAMGVINVTLMWVWSPGITISTPSSSSIVPVTSVVRK